MKFMFFLMLSGALHGTPVPGLTAKECRAMAQGYTTGDPSLSGGDPHCELSLAPVATAAPKK